MVEMKDKQQIIRGVTRLNRGKIGYVGSYPLRYRTQFCLGIFYAILYNRSCVWACWSGVSNRPLLSYSQWAQQWIVDLIHVLMLSRRPLHIHTFIPPCFPHLRSSFSIIFDISSQSPHLFLSNASFIFLRWI